MKKAVLTVLGVLLFTGLGLAGWLGWQTWSFLNTPPETPGREVLFFVEPGQTFDRTAHELKNQGLITDVRKFRFLGRYEEATGRIRAGEFRLNTGWKPRRILSHLTSAMEVLHRLQVREGLTWWNTGRVVEEAGFGSFDSFREAVFDPELLAAYDIPATNAEGYLFPETYNLPRPRENDARPVVEAMLNEFNNAAREVWPQGPPPSVELHRLVILASLVEKETGEPSERARIAGVYANRLKRGMRLQCDPTTIYGLGLAFDGNLKRSHLEDSSNPYNTYRHGGLPPGPICSFGIDALKAAAAPEEHSYLYFVAKGDGTHYFSRSLREHNNAVIKYQLRRRRK